MKVSRCRSCDAEIIWAVTTSQKSMPLDNKATLSVKSGYRLVPVPPDVAAIDPAALPSAWFTKNPRPDEPLYTSHFATCPNADAHRRKT